MAESEKPTPLLGGPAATEVSFPHLGAVRFFLDLSPQLGLIWRFKTPGLDTRAMCSWDAPVKGPTGSHLWREAQMGPPVPSRRLNSVIMVKSGMLGDLVASILHAQDNFGDNMSGNITGTF